ncbi:hypothetical protein L204_103964 [Cryptococcus depauperatus]|nr:pre-mRNA cleavage complex 2 protein Pcf11 [Cryptococcus depauperatus CBS 7855]
MAYHVYPPFQPTPFYPPAQAPPYPADSFRRQYADRLRTLTFNSRPIIQELSLMAMAARDRNDWDAMQAVVEEIELAVLRAHPAQKLPLLYLLDSISKNVGPPYTTHLLPSIMPRLYIKTYRDVDGVTKTKMEEMIGLWRTSGHDGHDLYGSQVREQVEKELFGSSGLQGTKTPNRQQVQVLVTAALENKRREIAINPGDVVLSRQLNALMGIGDLLNKSAVQPQELTMIMEQVQAMATSTLTLPPATPVWNGPSSVGHHAPANLPPFPPKMPANGGHSSAPVGIPPFPTPPMAVSSPTVVKFSTPVPPIPSTTPVSTPAASSNPNIPVDVARILQTLNKSGIGSQTPTHEVNPETLQPKTGLEAYEELILNLDIKLQSIDLNASHHLWFDHLPHRCQQCGMRFTSADAAFDAHMDWHFRRNRKERESLGRGAHRKWLPRIEEWIHDTLLATHTDTLSPTRNHKATVSAERLAQLRQKWVKVPEDLKEKASVCPVCKEAFKAEWSEAEEEWIWKNALNINGNYYHATCRAEQTSALKRLRAADPNRRTSTSGSPRTTPSNDLPKMENQKRKAGEGDQDDESAKRVKAENYNE